MNTFTMARFDPGLENEPIEVRTIVADDEIEAGEMLGEPFDGTYWTVLDYHKLDSPLRMRCL